MKMFTNDFDFVIADTPEEAKKIAIETQGYSVEDLDCSEFEPMDGRKMFTLRTDDTSTRQRIAKFVKEYGKGYFACTEY